MPSVAAKLALYFLTVAAVSLLALPLEPPTLLAVKIAPPLVVAVIGSCAAAGCAVLDHVFVRRTLRWQFVAAIRQKKLFLRAEGWAKVAPFWTTAAFAGFPVPFVIVRVLVPLSGYPLGRYVAAVTVGRFPRFLVIAAFGDAVGVPTPVIVGIAAGSVLLAGLAVLARRLGWIRSTPLSDEKAPAVAAPPEA